MQAFYKMHDSQPSTKLYKIVFAKNSKYFETGIHYHKRLIEIVSQRYNTNIPACAAITGDSIIDNLLPAEKTQMHEVFKRQLQFFKEHNFVYIVKNENIIIWTISFLGFDDMANCLKQIPSPYILDSQIKIDRLLMVFLKRLKDIDSLFFKEISDQFFTSDLEGRPVFYILKPEEKSKTNLNYFGQGKVEIIPKTRRRYVVDEKELEDAEIKSEEKEGDRKVHGEEVKNGDSLNPKAEGDQTYLKCEIKDGEITPEDRMFEYKKRAFAALNKPAEERNIFPITPKEKEGEVDPKNDKFSDYVFFFMETGLKFMQLYNKNK